MAILRRKGGLLAGGMGRAGNFSALPDSAPVTLALDTFTDTNGVALDAHTMDVGSGWTHQIGTTQIQSNKAVSNVTGSGAVHNTNDVGVANLTIEMIATVYFVDSANDTSAAILSRYVDANNFWMTRIHTDTNTFDLFENTGGSFTQRDTASVSIDDATTYTLKITPDGDDITALLDGGNELTYTSSQHNTATLHGFRTVENGTATSPTIDSWTATA